MFIPSEAIYYETIAEKNYLNEPSAIYEFTQAHKVIPVSPNTFYAFLQVVIIGIRNIEIIKSAKKLQDSLATLERSFEYFHKQYESVGKHLEKATEAFRTSATHIDRYKRQLDTTLRLEDLHEHDKNLPPTLTKKTP